MKQTKKIIILFALLGAVLFSAQIFAKQIMKGVPQEHGISDIGFQTRERPFCEECHGEALADTHHATVDAEQGNCVKCHPVQENNAGVKLPYLQRNCLKCHIESPHHKTQAALNNECNECHDTGISDFKTSIPTYEASMVTPTAKTCSNCHITAEVNGQKVSGPKDTHHDTGLKTCEACHAEKREDKNVRICEACHNPDALHSIEPHVVKENCVGCHDIEAAKGGTEPAPTNNPPKKK
ncbi:MAG: hypothetical protein OEZ13_06660 [Spirochaetia bacterium]|nr:hypothetical protein [Spirochaetia bacterium]